MSTEEAAPASPAPWWSRADPVTAVGLAAAIVCSVFVFFQLRPDLLLADNTPSGGDMGAHVWGPAFLRDSLLADGRLTGWTPDWYAGFPAYHFYMVVPALGILGVNAGLAPWLGIPLAILALAAGHLAARRHPRGRVLAYAASVTVAILVIAVPYGIAFKMVAVSGLVAFPLAAYAMARLARCQAPVAGFLAFGAVIFLFDTNFTIYGGNIASTLAGEFAFSISLSLTLIAIGLAIRGMDTSSWRASTAIVVALVALCHIIPLFFLMAALVLLVVLHPSVPRWWVIGIGLSAALIPVGQAAGNGLLLQAAAVLSFAVVFGAIVAADSAAQKRFRWLLVTGPTAALLSAFWLVPFYLRSDLFNDMGWERLDDVGPALLTNPMRVALPVAAVGAVLAFAVRDRLGMLFTILAVTFASAVANLPDGKLWNARLLPFYYLSVYFLAAIALALVARFAAAAVAERLDRPDRTVLIGGTALGLLATLIAVSIPLRILPFQQQQDDGTYTWLGLESNAQSFVPTWVAWNFSGYEDKRSFREYRDVVSTMDAIGTNRGCGRAMWEYDKELDRYGTPMALMLLPHWTDGCIGSMEGLYFESSATTPFHFLNQSALSVAPSRAQRDLPYQAFDIDRGIAQLQVMGVRYYLALSDEAIDAAAQHPDLTQIERSEPFVVYEVAGSELVQGLSYEPVVTRGQSIDNAGEVATRFDVGWLGQAVTYYNDPDQYQAMPAVDGPASWRRVDTLLPSDGVPLDPAVVTGVDVTTDRISFSVDQVGKPVVVKTSYFPNWEANGADGPWRIGPNQMVVVPTETSVELTYGSTSAEFLGYLLTLGGLVALVSIALIDRSSRRS